MTWLQHGLAAIGITSDRWQLAAMARGMLRGYDARWRASHASIEVLEIEATYLSKLTNLQTMRTSRTFSVAGKIDKLVRQNGALTLYDHKTTSMDITDPDSPYWRQLAVESQVSHYELLLLANAIKLEQVVWDVVRKPGIKPRKLTKKDLAEIVSLGSYCGFDLSDETVAFAKFGERENADLYECRVAQETIDNPDRYFARRSAKRLRSELVEYATELWDIASEMRPCNAKRHYRNSDACMNYGTPCRFLGVCSGHDTIESDKWYRTNKVHDELELGSEINGREVLTNSRLKCFQTCKRKHYYEYELGIRRVEEEEREVLYFGSLWGRAMDEWWWGEGGETHE